MNVKIEQELNFVVDNDRRMFLDAQEAKKVSERSCIYVTGFGKTLRVGFFQKIEFDAWLISSTIELTHVQVLGRSCAWFWRYSALFAIAPHPQ